MKLEGNSRTKITNLKNELKEKLGGEISVNVKMGKIMKTRGGKRPMIINSITPKKSSQYELSEIFAENI